MYIYFIRNEALSIYRTYSYIEFKKYLFIYLFLLQFYLLIICSRRFSILYKICIFIINSPELDDLQIFK